MNTLCNNIVTAELFEGFGSRCTYISMDRTFHNMCPLRVGSLIINSMLNFVRGKLMYIICKTKVPTVYTPGVDSTCRSTLSIASTLGSTTSTMTTGSFTVDLSALHANGRVK